MSLVRGRTVYSKVLESLPPQAAVAATFSFTFRIPTHGLQGGNAVPGWLRFCWLGLMAHVHSVDFRSTL